MNETTSLLKLPGTTSNGLTRDTEPMTTAVINAAAPKSSLIAILPLLDVMAAKVGKILELPLSKAKNVTPASVSLIQSINAMVLI